MFAYIYEYFFLYLYQQVKQIKKTISYGLDNFYMTLKTRFYEDKNYCSGKEFRNNKSEINLSSAFSLRLG